MGFSIYCKKWSQSQW